MGVWWPSFWTDPGWAGCGSPSCRGSRASLAPSTPDRSSCSLQAWFRSRLQETHRCHPPAHNHGQGVARKQIPLLSISVCINTCALTHRQHTGSIAVQVPLSTLDFRCVRSQSLAHLLSTSLERRVGGWSREETGLSSPLVRPGPTHCPPPLLCAQNIPGMLNDGAAAEKWQQDLRLRSDTD